MNIMKTSALIVTSPLWLAVALLVICVCLPLLVATFIASVCMYGFTGEWDWL